MSYRVDIPTLSANEVYTLTFEYEGTETIQLIVGDLTLETTDRRVVFTTTSPVNYIESNVNLTNLSIYEGYYESDDFGGEYVQESMIEGKSLVNLIQSKKHLDFQNGGCGVETFEDNMIKLTITDVSSLNPNSTWQHGWMKTSANLKVGATYTCVVHVVENSIKAGGISIGASHGTLVHGSASTSLGSGETGVIVFTYIPATATLKNYNGYYDGFCHVAFSGDWQNGSLKYGIMVFEGDYYDYFINNNIPYFEGIGCVKSPVIASKEEPNNLFYMKDWTSTLNGGTAHSKDGKIYFSGNFKGYTYFDIINGGEKKDNIYLEPGTYYMKMKVRSLLPATSNGVLMSIDAYCSDGSYASASVYTTKDQIYDMITGTTLTTTSPIVEVTLKIWYGGDRSNLIVEGVSISKVNEKKYTDSKYSVISTPDDLELYCNYRYNRNTKKSSPCHQDTLDLATGTVTRKNIKVRLNDVLSNKLFEGKLRTVDGVDMVNVTWNHINTTSGTFPVQIDGEVIGTSATGIVLGASQGGYDGHWNPVSEMEHAYTNTNTLFMYLNLSRFNNIDYTNSTTITNWIKEQDFTLIIKIKDASVYTEQLSLNVLQSYRNGSITTSSQQLAPTLKTTLPISNKFTQTNLSSGQTYNIYFEGTATKLDAGGTIITNPVSPCEVECGGTTLTIEGTDIQNIRVLEDTVKNEVGNNGTGDVELSKIETSDVSGENITTSDLKQPIKLRSLGTTYDSYNPITGELTKRIGVSETDGSYSVLSSPIVTTLEGKAIDVFGNAWITQNSPATTLGHYINDKDGQLGTSTSGVSFYTHDYLPIPKVSFKVRGQNRYKRVVFYDSNKVFVKGLLSPHTDNSDFEITLNNIPINAVYVRYSASLADNDITYVPEQSLFIVDAAGNDLNCCINNVLHLYANGQVKVYSESNVYPTTILNGQSTNNYEINELKTSDNYTIRYDGVCESINLANKSNTQGTNRIVKSGATSGNLTFVNNSGDINNVLLVQNDVRGQEINHFTGVQTVEVSRILIQNQNQSQYIDLPQPVQLNSLPDGTCDTYNPITGEYVQRVNGKPYTGEENWNRGYYQFNCMSYSLELDKNNPEFSTSSYCTDLKRFDNSSIDDEGYFLLMGANYTPILTIRLKRETLSGISFEEWLVQSGIVIFHAIKPITTQLTPIEIPASEGGILQLITTDGKVFPMIEYSMPTNNRYDTSTWETGAVYTQRNMTEAYFNESTTPMTPTETMTLTTDHISSGSIILNDNGNGLIVLKGNYTGRDIPYFTGMRSVEAIEIETTPSPDQPLFGKGGRK